ncbi:cytochrome P450 [Dactylosporangium sp. CA-233914]|uniref:cytochrome P450 n=1 Tax=Dactylosporangium sp. CA-233914 TaxID=3239934 RepID=UPI003D908E69
MTEVVGNSAESAAAKGCPIVHEEFFESRKLGAHWALGDRLREQGTVHWNTHAQGYWMFAGQEAVRDIFRNPDVFSSQSITPWDPFPEYKTIPTMVDGQDHLNYRRLLNPWFTAERVRTAELQMRAIASRRISEIKPKGQCDFPAEFALDYPTEVFLSFTGMNVEDTPKLRGWVDDFFAGYGGDPATQEAMANGIAGLTHYWQEAVNERRGESEPRAGDFASFLMHQSFGGERPLTDKEVVDLLLLAVIGGLDTTKSQLSYFFRHLAENPGDRNRLVAEPDIIPSAVEEALRFYTITFGDGRKVTQDIHFHGVDLKEGDMVWAMVASANRDPKAFERANEFVVDRKKNLHAGFALGPHRCLGIHLARASMRIATEEWLKQIPVFRMNASEELTERGAGSMLAPWSVPLAWK